MGQGKLNKQIAGALNITEATVKAHITTVFRKLGIRNRAQAARLAAQYRAGGSGPLQAGQDHGRAVIRRLDFPGSCRGCLARCP